MKTSQMSSPYTYQKPENAGKPWPPESDAKLLRMLSSGSSVYECADCFKRTVGGIKSRRMTIACNLVNNGKSIEEVADIFKVPVSMIQESLDILEDTSEASKLSALQRQERKNEKAKMRQEKINNMFEKLNEDSPISLLREIRDLLKQVVINANKD